MCKKARSFPKLYQIPKFRAQRGSLTLVFGLGVVYSESRIAIRFGD